MEMSPFIRFEYSTVICIFKKLQASLFKDENKKSEYLWEVSKTSDIFSGSALRANFQLLWRALAPGRGFCLCLTL